MKITVILSTFFVFLFTLSSEITLISNLGLSQTSDKSYSFKHGQGHAVDFRLDGDQSFQLKSVVLKLKLGPKSSPKLVLVGTPRRWQSEPVPLNEAAGLGIGGPYRQVIQLNAQNIPSANSIKNVVFIPEKDFTLEPGIWRLALTSDNYKDDMTWRRSKSPVSGKYSAVHLRQAFGRSNREQHAWYYGAGRDKYSLHTMSGQYSINGNWIESKNPNLEKESVIPEYASYSGIYPHLAMFNTADHTECGIGAVVNWANRLWAVTYAPYNHNGSPDKLFSIDSKHHIYIYPEDSVGGTPANRMIHKESNQLLIGSHVIDSNGNIRTIPIKKMQGRMTGTARHLVDPENKVYYATMEEGLYEVDVNTLDFKVLHRDRGNFAHGNHGKGLYSGQGNLIYANNGGSGHANVRKLNQEFKQVGSLNQWNGKSWTEVHRTGFLDVTGPGGIKGNENPDTDPVWSIGWDYRSVILKVLDRGKWSTYRLPKASHTMDGPHGYNTEWPRIGEIGKKDERLMYVHGMFWKFPNTFSSSNSHGLKPRSTYLKMVSDSTPWKNKIAFACNDLSNESQAIRLNPRKIRGKLIPSISHSNLWFVDNDEIDNFGIPLGKGSVWMYDNIFDQQNSDAFQFSGWDRRLLHLSHKNEKEAHFQIELDFKGNGQWEAYKKISVEVNTNKTINLSQVKNAEWIRLVALQDTKEVIATFHYSNLDHRHEKAHKIFDGLLTSDDENAQGGIIRIKSNDGAPLAMALDDGSYYEMGTDMQLKKVDHKNDEMKLRSIAKIIDPGLGGLSSDEASVIYTDDDGKRYRLPRGSSDFDKVSKLGFSRVDREVCRERNLFNTHGIMYELPYRNAGGFPLIRPITTHNRQIKDFCSWRGLLVMTGLDSNTHSNNIVRSKDHKAGVWLGVVDDLWKMGKSRGFGGPWKNSSVEKNTYSDPFLMNGFDQKIINISHNSPNMVTVSLEIDITGYGDWKLYKNFEVNPESQLTYEFPEEFSAYWIRAKSNQKTIATLQFNYK